jgi:Fur family ferric uptake transcriptional regulator
MEGVSELRRAGLRATPQRALVLRVLEQGHGHLTAEGVVEAIEREGLPLNRSTVYRTLDALSRAGIVRATRMGRATHYEAVGDGHRHHHLVCQRCHATVPIAADAADAALARAAGAAGFSVSEIDVLVTGLCPACRA